jgi:hypothetical protein
MSPRVQVVLVNWNGWRDTIECLESLFRLDYPAYTVVVCDNASGDGSLERIREWALGQRPAPASNPALAHLVTPPVPKPLPFVDYDRREAEQGGRPDDSSPLVLVQTGANLGFAGGCNVGIRHALARQADFVWLLNTDTAVHPDALGQLVARATRADRPAMVGSTVVFHGDPGRIQARGGARYDRWRAAIAHEGLLDPLVPISDEATSAIESRLAYVFGASLLVSRPCLEQVGLMTEDYFLFFEEIDWAERAGRQGGRLGYAAESLVYHKAGAVTGSARETDFSQFLMTRNRLLFIWRHHRPLLPLNYLFLWLDAARAAARGRWGKARAMAGALLGLRLFAVPAPATGPAG